MLRRSTFWLSGLLWLWTAGCSDAASSVAPWTYDASTPRADAGAPGPGHANDDDDDGGAAVGAGQALGDTDTAVARACREPHRPSRAALRRLSRAEYSNTLRDLLGDTTSPGNQLPSEQMGNNFGNDASRQSISSLLAEQYGNVAEDVAARATGTPEALAKLAACAATARDADELRCARSSVERLARRAFRRPLASDELDELVQLWQSAREDSDFATGMATVIEALLQSPDFLYRPEWGEPDAADPSLLRPSGYEMATRLSYMYWGSMPDESLLMAAAQGQLSDPEQIRAQAERLLAERARSRTVLRFFFDSLLPISGLSALSRDSQVFPQYNARLGAFLREETLQYLEREIFDSSASWPEILTEPYTYLNEPLATFYGVDGVRGEDFRRVELDTSQRLGLLTQAGVLAGTAHSNVTSPVLRGSFIVQRLLCRTIPLPTGEILAQVKPPAPSSGLTGRERYSAHSSNPVCHSCHQYMDPLGLALENFDAMGLFRSSENGVEIDASGSMPDGHGAELSFNGPIELVRALAGSSDAVDCFAAQWLSFAYGQDAAKVDECSVQTLKSAFATADYEVKALLLALAQTDAFLYLAHAEGEP